MQLGQDSKQTHGQILQGMEVVVMKSDSSLTNEVSQTTNRRPVVASISLKPWEFIDPVCSEVGTSFFYSKDRDDPDLKYEEDEESDRTDYSLARSICSTCIYKAPCREWGIHHEAHGVWGGMSPKERQHARSRRGIILDSLS